MQGTWSFTSCLAFFGSVSLHHLELVFESHRHIQNRGLNGSSVGNLEREFGVLARSTVAVIYFLWLLLS